MKLQKTENEIPLIIEETINWLKKNDACKEEGIFRKSGSTILINELKEKYEKKCTVDLSNLPKRDIHSVAGLLKLYLRELPEPLFIFRFYEAFLDVASNKEETKRLINLKKLINGLPKSNKKTVLFLLQFLGEIAKKQRANKNGLLQFGGHFHSLCISRARIGR